MQPYNKIEESGYAICWELCELERHFFNKHKIENHTIMAVIKIKRVVHHATPLPQSL